MCVCVSVCVSAMDHQEGTTHTVSTTDAASQDKNTGASPRRRPRRAARPPAWVRVPLVLPQHHTTTTTTQTNHHHRRRCRALRPITKFCLPQGEDMCADRQLASALLGNKTVKDVMGLLQTLPPTEREQLVWDIFGKFHLLFNHHQPNPSPWVKVSLFSEFPGGQSEVLVYNGANRYQLEFEEEGELGYGGFGRVVRARNRLDRLCYAVKMIILNVGEASLEACVQEVRALAGLDHPHVVRYYTAWVQPVLWPQHSHRTPATLTRLTSDTSDDTSARYSSENYLPPSFPPFEEGNTPSDESVVFQDTEEGKGEAVAHPSFTYSTHQASRQTQSPSSSQESEMAPGSLLPYKPPPLPQLRNVLYIQMRLCGKSLRKWMDLRNASKSPVVVESECLRIFHQVVEAVCYIHHKGYMHRDIKPANIFFTLEGCDVQLGDLGLARMMTHPLSVSPPSPHTSLSPQTYTMNVGTPLYTAPEMKGGIYGQKSDMYSLGIILLELFVVFRTNSERNVVIGDLKTNGDLDPHLLHHCPPLIAYWIKRLIDKDPDSRPTAQELLDSNLFPEPKPPPSPITPTTAAIATVGESFGWRFRHQAVEKVELAQSEFNCVDEVEINEIQPDECDDNKVIIERSVNNRVVRIERQLSKDERIALLQEENYALKRELEALKRDLAQFKLDSASRGHEN